LALYPRWPGSAYLFAIITERDARPCSRIHCQIALLPGYSAQEIGQQLRDPLHEFGGLRMSGYTSPRRDSSRSASDWDVVRVGRNLASRRVAVCGTRAVSKTRDIDMSFDPPSHPETVLDEVAKIVTLNFEVLMVSSAKRGLARAPGVPSRG